jgi:hypothetical protein
MAATVSRATAAMDEIKTWVNAHFRRFHASIEQLHPAWTNLFPEVDSRNPADVVSTQPSSLAARDSSLQRKASTSATRLSTLTLTTDPRS